MKKYLKTVKASIVALMLCFALAVTTLVVSFSYYLVYQYQLRINLQSVSFSLQLVAKNIERDLTDAFSLANWCSIGANPPARYLVSRYDPVLAVSTYERLQEEWANKRISEYLDRVVVISNTDNSRMLQTGRNTSSKLLFMDKDAKSPIAHYTLYSTAHVYDITYDPFSRREAEVINVLAPVFIPGGRDIIGTVYLALSTRLVSDNLKGYSLPEGAVLYLTIDNLVYRIEDGSFFLTDELGQIEPNENVFHEEKSLTIGTVKDDEGKNLDAVTFTIRNDLALTQVFDSSKALPSASSWLPLVMGICLLILVLTFLAIFTMNRTISQPVVKIGKKLQKIAEGDFSPEPDIESDSEIGSVGRGINQLSRDVADLMETRLASEKSKRELEYRMLQSQINPHFLYNSLGAIKWMGKLQKADGIVEMTSALSRLLRTVSKDQRKVVPLRDEIALLDDYYVTLKYRYGGTVSFDKYIENKDILDSCLPRFVLQPLMENAIFHGIEPKGRGRIELHASRDGEKVCVSIRDDGIGVDPVVLKNLDLDAAENPEESQAAVGMRSVHQRIRNVFGPEYGLSVESELGKYTKTSLYIPYMCQENLISEQGDNNV